MKVNQTSIITFLTIFCCFVILVACKEVRKSNGNNMYESEKVEQCRAAYANARKLQKDEKYDQAIKAFKACLLYQSGNKTTCDSLVPTVVNTILQLMNSYQACGRMSECVEYYHDLYTHPTTPMIRKYCMRDVSSVYAYALYRNDNMDEAERMMQKTLTMPYDTPMHERLFRDYSYAAALYYCDPKKQDLVMRYGRIALRESEYCTHTSGAQWLMTVMARSYDRKGEISKAIALYKRAIKVAKAKNDTLGAAYAYLSLSSIFIEWDMPVYANDCASKVIDKLKGVTRYPDIVNTAYIRKADALHALARDDSMYIYLKRARTFCKDLPYVNGMSNIEYLEGVTIVQKCTGDSLLRGISLLKNVVRHNSVENPSAFFALAQAYFRQGDDRQGEAMLDSMYQLLHQSTEPSYISGAYLFAIKHYIRQKDDKNIIRYGKALALEDEFSQNRQIASKLADLIVRTNTEKKEQQLQNYRIKAENSSLKLAVFIYVSLVVVLLAIPIILYRRKMYHAQAVLMKERLDALSYRMQEEMKKYDKTKDKLAELVNSSEKRRNIHNLSADVIKEEGETEFRRHFEILYPQFITELHKRTDNLGRREELVCMLVVLNQDNHQIGDLLNIAYRSVVVAKHRIKQKMQLEADENLDNILKEIIKKN